MGYNGEGNVYLLPSKEILKEFSNVSVGKLVEVSINYKPDCPVYIQFSFVQITLGYENEKSHFCNSKMNCLARAFSWKSSE